MNQPGQFTLSTMPASLFRWASRIPSSSLRSQLDFLLNEFDPLFGIQRMAAEVVDVIAEAEGTKTYVLRPSVYWKGFVPGQYVTIEVDINGVRHRRNYSISSSPISFERDGLISITAKRVEGGKVSNHLADALQTGALLHVSAAKGEFVLDNKPGARAPLFLAAGSGITPIMSMLTALAETNALGDVVLIYAVRSRQDLIFAQQLSALAEAHPGFVYIPHIAAGKRGQLNATHLPGYCPDLAERALYLCGPEGFMSMVKQAAPTLGVNASELHSESFGQPRARGLAEELARLGKSKSEGNKALPVRVQLAKAQKTLEASGTQTLLELAEQAGLKPKYGCRSGICHECKCEKASGRVMNALTGELVPEEQTHIQACISIPVDDVTIASW